MGVTDKATNLSLCRNAAGNSTVGDIDGAALSVCITQNTADVVALSAGKGAVVRAVLDGVSTLVQNQTNNATVVTTRRVGNVNIGNHIAQACAGLNVTCDAAHYAT